MQKLHRELAASLQLLYEAHSWPLAPSERRMQRGARNESFAHGSDTTTRMARVRNWSVCTVALGAFALRAPVGAEPQMRV